DTALERVKHANENMTYLDEEAKNIIKSMQIIVDIENPYKKIHELPMIIEKYNDKLVDLYEKEAEQVRPIIETHKKEVLDYLSQFDFYEELKAKYFNKFVSLTDELNEARRFSDILAMPSRSDRMKNIAITEIDVEEQRRKPTPPPVPPKVVGGDSGNDKPVVGGGSVKEPPAKVKTTRNVAKSSIVPYQPVINNKEDIEKLLESMRIRLEKELQENGEFKLI
ncbi:MAG: hypothetical protein ACRC3Y_19100, partial [Romboutsia sp.]|uniref:hypothetical protein n=1 Tax=Romboutsia sp. TaxID=1965302 RepID=UPI003F2C7524